MAKASASLRVAISTSSFGEYDRGPVEALEALGIEVVFNPHGRKLEPDEAIELMKGAAGAVAGTEKLSRAVLQALPEMKVISRCGAGMDNVDIDAAREFGIKLYSAPEGPTLAVAELTVGLILSLLRRVPEMDRDIRSGIWKKRMGNLLAGKRVGIIGFGRIGRETARLLAPFGVELRHCDIQEKACPINCERISLDDMLGWAEIITLHLSASPSCHRIIGAREFGLMRRGAWIINAARGGLVDEEALGDALTDGRLGGAALDVFEREPYLGPLAKLPNVILTPHIGSYAVESRVQMERRSVDNLIAGLRESGVI